MYGINDVFDYESDLRNPRKGGVEGALLDPAQHRRVIIAAIVTNVPFLVFLVVIGSWLSWIVLAVSVFAVVAYSAPGLRFKERPFLDSVTSSTHFVSPAVYGLVLAGATFTPQLWFLLAAFFLWGVSSHAFGAVQDVVADREGGIASIATAIGARATVRLSVIGYLAAGVLLLFTTWPGTAGRDPRAALRDQLRTVLERVGCGGRIRSSRLAAVSRAQLRQRISGDPAAHLVRAGSLAKSTIAAMMVGSDSTRVWPRPLVNSSVVWPRWASAMSFDSEKALT